MDTEYLNKLKGLGGGISLVGGWRYISGTATGNPGQLPPKPSGGG
jgi:hypothetical protein